MAVGSEMWVMSIEKKKAWKRTLGKDMKCSQPKLKTGQKKKLEHKKHNKIKNPKKTPQGVRLLKCANSSYFEIICSAFFPFLEGSSLCLFDLWARRCLERKYSTMLRESFLVVQRGNEPFGDNTTNSRPKKIGSLVRSITIFSGKGDLHSYLKRFKTRRAGNNDRILPPFVGGVVMGGLLILVGVVSLEWFRTRSVSFEFGPLTPCLKRKVHRGG